MTWISVVIPAYNEERRLPDTLADVSSYLREQDFGSEIVVVDDGSSDRTANAARDIDTGVPCEVISRPSNGGKGAATRDGIMAATGEFVLLMDADNSARIVELPKLLVAGQSEAVVVIGSRYAAGSNIEVRQPLHRVAISRVGNQLIQKTVLPGVKDTQCGFKLLPRAAATEIAAKLTRDRFSFDIELLVVATSLGLEIVESPINWSNHPETKLKVFRSSIELLRDLAWIRSRYGSSSYRKATAELVAEARDPHPGVVA